MRIVVNKKWLIKPSVIKPTWHTTGVGTACSEAVTVAVAPTKLTSLEKKGRKEMNQEEMNESRVRDARAGIHEAGRHEWIKSATAN
jgi:hypothetical protein